MHSFLKQANAEPDLADAMEPLARIIYNLEEIQKKIRNIPRAKRHDEVRRVGQVCEQLLDEHLPEMISKYCLLSVQFRNEEIVKAERNTQGGLNRYTSKEILLQNLTRLLQESVLLDNQLNAGNSGDFLAKSRMINDNFGVQPQFDLSSSGIALNTGDLEVEFKNTFNFKTWQEEQKKSFAQNMFKKLPEKKAPKPEVQPAVEAVSEDMEESENIFFAFLDPAIFITIISLCFVTILAFSVVHSASKAYNPILPNADYEQRYSYQRQIDNTEITLLPKEKSAFNELGLHNVEVRTTSQGYVIAINELPYDFDLCVATSQELAKQTEGVLGAYSLTTTPEQCALKGNNGIAVVGQG